MEGFFAKNKNARARTSDHHDLIAQRFATREDASQGEVASQQEQQARFPRMLGRGRTHKIKNSRNEAHAHGGRNQTEMHH